MNIPISQFGELCQLPTQTLRFYHSEGLLVPAHVDERTGYRSYDFGQIGQAMLIATLRRAGLSVRHVRQALDDVDTTPRLLIAHREALRRERQQQDQALDDAQAFVTDWPQVRHDQVLETLVISTIIPGRADDVFATVRAQGAAHELTTTAVSCGATVTGLPWKAYALNTTEQKKKIMTRDGLDWSVSLPVAADGRMAAALPATATLTTFSAREEVSVVMPGRETLAKHGTALTLLSTYALEQNYVPDLGRPRHLLRDDGVELAIAIWTADDDPAMRASV